MSRDIYVYADWADEEPILVGTLTAEQVQGKEHFSFAYALDWLQREDAPYLQVDPELHLFEGIQHKGDDHNFRTFLDSCPDRWGRLLMQRREAVLARQDGRKPKTLYESDYLLGVFDQYRMGALRFKIDRHGVFLDDDERLSAPPITSLRELEHAVRQIEQNVDLDDPEYMKWLFMLISPGSSLGGARPKASVMDEEGNLWIAKFPSQQDDHDIGAWEFLAYRLAVEAGITMVDCRIERFNSPHHTFLTKRFDREREQRMHFSSAMTQLGYYNDLSKF